MDNFEFFLKTNEVRKDIPNIALARFLIKDMDERIDKCLQLDMHIFSKMIFENMYDALQDFCNSLLALEGFKSYSHVASIEYLRKFGFNDYELNLFDKFRLRRHSSKYYGVGISFEEAEEIFDFYNKIKNRIETILKGRGVK